MRFTVVTPVFNGMPWLPECIASVNAQRADVDVEHLVYDAGSTDGSREWLQANAGRAILHFEQDRGQADALHKGLTAATGTVLGWLNADDILEPRALARVAAAFERDADAVAVVGSCLMIDARGVPHEALAAPERTSLEELLSVPNNLPQQSTFFTRDAYRAVGGLDASFSLAFDGDLWRRLAAHGRILSMPTEVLARYRIHPASRTQSNAALSAREDLRSRRRFGQKLASYAGLTLLKRGYLYPLLPAGSLEAARKVVNMLRGSG